MQFGASLELESQPSRAKTLVISIAIHLVLIAFVVIRPDLLQSTPKRVIRIAGQDYDASQIRELTLVPPAEAAVPPRAQNTPPLIQPDVPAQAAPPPPPPPPPPSQPVPPPPDIVIGPDDVLAEGARPDAEPRASRGDTGEPARTGTGAASTEEPTVASQPAQEAEPERLARNMNPNSLSLPNLRDRAGQIVQESLGSQRQYQGGRTGVSDGREDPNFSTEEPTILSDTRGYDFGPYMNQVVNRVRVNWYSLIPEVARLGRTGKVVIIFTIVQSGSIQDVRLVANSGTDPLDRAAMGAITASNPFPRLPSNFDGERLVLQFTFLYNMR